MSKQRLIAAAQMAVVVLACAVLLPAISPGQAVGSGLGMRLLFLGRMAFLLIVATLFLRQRGLGWKNVGFERPNWIRLAIAVPLGLVACAIAAFAATAIAHKLGLRAPNYTMFAPLKGNVAEYLFWLLPVSLASAAFGEELLFRGFLINALATMMGQGRSVWIVAAVAQAVIFGALHFYQGAGGAIAAGSIGLVLGFVWLFSGRNLWAGILIHAFLDCSAMTVIFLKGPPSY